MIKRNLPAIILFIAVLILWEGGVRSLGIQKFLLPAPSVILQSFIEKFDQLVYVGWFTTKEALGGFAIGCSAGIIIALATARWTLASEALMPFAIAANSVPIVAFAPIVNSWFGIDNPLPKMVILSIIVFFPMMINTVRGLTLVDIAMIDLEIGSIVKQLQAERGRLTSPKGGTLNRTVEEFQRLEMETVFAQYAYKTALVALEKGRMEATRNLKKVSLVQSPTLPQYPLEPRRIYNMLVFTLSVLVLAGIVQLLAAIIRDHKD